jgi:hypothetical protein
VTCVVLLGDGAELFGSLFSLGSLAIVMYLA